MRAAILTVGAMIAMTGPSQAGEAGSDTTSVRNGDNLSIITQSGDPAQAVIRIEKQPGRTVIIRQSGGNTSIVTQDSGMSDVPLRSLPKELRDLFVK